MDLAVRWVCHHQSIVLVKQGDAGLQSRDRACQAGIRAARPDQLLFSALALGDLGFQTKGNTVTTREPPFLNRDLLRDRNFVVGLPLMFFVGVIMFATLALMPTMLQQSMNYPVATAGLVNRAARHWYDGRNVSGRPHHRLGRHSSANP